MQGTVNVKHYKGAMLLRVLPEHSCCAFHYPSVGLRGDDLAALIRLLREAKRVWLHAYRKAARENAKRKHGIRKS